MQRGRFHWAAVISVVTLYGLLLSPLDPLMTNHVVPHQTTFVLVAIPFVIGLALGRDAAICLPAVVPILSLAVGHSCVTHETASASTTICTDYALLPVGIVLAIALFVFARSGALFARGFRSAF